MSVEMISVHIPKSGGQSMYQVLASQYGAGAIAYPWSFLGMRPEQSEAVDLLMNRQDRLCRMWKAAMKNIPSHIKVLQGHFPVWLFNGLFPEAKRVVWLRNPRERVVSAYYHWKQNGFIPEDESIEVFAKRLEQKNVATLLTGYEGDGLPSFDFVGIVERFDDDIHKLAKMMGWQNYPVPHVGENDYEQPEKKVKSMISRLNRTDRELYAYSTT